MKNQNAIRNLIKEKGQKVTPQRVAILEAISGMKNHPTVESIITFLEDHHPNIATGTVYKVLDVLVEKGLVNRVKTDEDKMRYDAILEPHHHLYCVESDRIEDYYDEDLNTLISEYFERHKIQGFEIGDIKLQIKGKFK